MPTGDMSITIEGEAVLEYEDGGCAAILQVEPDNDDEAAPFARIQSWSDDANPSGHALLRPLNRKRLRVTVEEVPDTAEGQLLAAVAAVESAEECLVAAVARMKINHSWQQVGNALGVSRQAAWERFHRKVEEKA